MTKMNIAEIVYNKFKHNESHHRTLSDNPSLGILFSGYVRKNTASGSHYNYTPNEYHGIFILSGEGIYQTDEGMEIPIQPGDFIQRFPGKTHSTIITSNDWSELYLSIGSHIYRSFAEIYVFAPDKPVLSPGHDFELIQQILDYHARLGNANRIELPLLLSEATAIIAKATYLDRIRRTTTDEMNILAMSIQYIEANITHRLSVEEVAAHVNMGYEKFRKLFTKQYRISPGNYILNRRINTAQKMLSAGKLSIKEIAMELGYPDSYSFSKQFKKLTGHTPSQFRHFYYHE
ncbi:helix-turn-helix transcriptional regulator [Vallitalea pronyensis]|uniref:Helix-turn-helix transcriptional regulator n=1 Tax=Vallitalea pronyensis TaxID=1348613 RepID=A0A8J8SGP0_9FIRM|nr:AraC family transcriptional regulator [Vallitalea pronyensis]QUI22589.1 helix-turn-helix transcriptional regulator [Vallitalea pronyensis]